MEKIELDRDVLLRLAYRYSNHVDENHPILFLLQTIRLEKVVLVGQTTGCDSRSSKEVREA